ncbi:MAG: hypothetical protein Tsb009_23200 [Planctomycetaceae bacterium]
MMKTSNFVNRSIVAWVVLHVFCLGVTSAFAQRRSFREIARFPAAEAIQGVAVDGQHFYAIANRTIGKYEKKSGRKVATWKSSRQFPLIHLNHGIVRNGKLYCAHSNSPGVPATSSVEIWDTKTLKHIDTHSFGIFEGSLTWIDWHDNTWWAVFAHYSSKALNAGGRDTRWTSLVKFDSRWRRLQSWVFPKSVLKKFEPYSNSGGGWGPDGRIYCSGHDAGELYVLRLPKSGSTLEHVETLPLNITGQAFAWDPSAPNMLYGISRAKKTVVVSRLEKRIPEK